MSATPVAVTIDAQVHAYERDRPERPWSRVLQGPPEVTGDDMVRALNEVGVDGAILVSPFTLYRFDASYAIEVQAAHPTRFAMVKPVDPNDPGVADTVSDWAAHDGAVGVRLMMHRDVAADDKTDRVFAAAAASALPLNLFCWGRLDQVATLARRHPETQIVIDHLGLEQPFSPPRPAEPWAALPEVLELADFDNVAIKITGACTLSHEPFPYTDLWPPLEQIFDRFGLERCLWGTDWTRAVELLTYEQGVEAFRVTDRLSNSERAMLMGGAAERIYAWSPGEQVPSR